CIHTGQHYSYEMDRIFFEELDLPEPEFKLDIRSRAPYMQGDHTGRMLIEIEKKLLEDMPYCIVVQGDTNTALAGALVAGKISTTESFTGFHIKVAHVEAGLRSYDRSMPEETNRFLADHLADFCLTPTRRGRKILLREGVPKSRIHVTGNTIVDVVMKYSKKAESEGVGLAGSDIAPNSGEVDFGLQKNKYILLTLHRQENVDSEIRFKNILQGLSLVSSKLNLPIVFLAHPRTWKMMQKFKIEMPKGIYQRQPQGFINFLQLEMNAALILTDSGGVQEESCVLKVPCVTLRDNTERPETVKVGANIIAGTKPKAILKAAIRMSRRKRTWKNPLGDGRASERILKILMR
ncbi:MAG: UDP-N-acetylglucosamine 2-epimerase (non-hydrolyzing), partial [Candidatus Omnitrophota bacterium]